jgi:hypothetical protein
MARLSLAALGLVLAVSTAARGQTYGEAGNTGARSVDRQQLREQLRNSGNPSGSTCPIRILADYGNRVAAESAKQSRHKSAWVGPGQTER